MFLFHCQVEALQELVKSVGASGGPKYPSSDLRACVTNDQASGVSGEGRRERERGGNELNAAECSKRFGSGLQTATFIQFTMQYSER